MEKEVCNNHNFTGSQRYPNLNLLDPEHTAIGILLRDDSGNQSSKILKIRHSNILKAAALPPPTKNQP